MTWWPAGWWPDSWYPAQWWAKIVGPSTLIDYTGVGGWQVGGEAETRVQPFRIEATGGVHLGGAAATAPPRVITGGLAVFLRRTLRRKPKRPPKTWWYQAEGGVQLAGRAEVDYRPASWILKPLGGILDVDIIGGEAA